MQLEWPAGQAQIDFGQAEAVIAGVRMVVHVFVVTFPFSNMRFVQAYRGETAECVCDGLRRVFEHIGMVPRLLVFDNATGIGRRTRDKIIESRLFSQFKQHYRTQARYCNPYSGNEKGNVENAVGFLRRNLMVPEPVAASLSDLNASLLAKCEKLADKPHWRKGQPISDLFAADVAAGLMLPGVAFDAVRYESRKADKTGVTTVDGNAYLAGPAFAGQLITVGLHHDVVELIDAHAEVLLSFPRVFGSSDTTQFQGETLLPAPGHKPGAWSHSPVRPLVTPMLRDWLDQASMSERARTFRTLSNATIVSSFETAVTAATRLIELGDSPAGAGMEMLARRLWQGSEPQPQPVNLAVYDQLAGRRHSA